MKPRRVLVMLELETDASLVTLKAKAWWDFILDRGSQYRHRVRQVQVNVIRANPKPKKKA